MTNPARYLQICLVCACALSAAAGPLQQKDLLQDLLITAQAHQRLQEEYRTLGSRGDLSDIEKSDFRNYLNNLAIRVADKCNTLLALFPDTEADGLPCAAPPPSMAPVVDVASERTTQETVAELSTSPAPSPSAMSLRKLGTVSYPPHLYAMPDFQPTTV